jgi:polar amino acid transport system permease protein
VDDPDSRWPFLPFLLGGVPVTLLVAALSMALAIPTAFILALGRGAKSPWLSIPSGFVIELFRGSSSLVQLFWAFYVLPFFGIELPALAAGVLVLGVNSGSYLSEVVRAGLNAVPQGQHEAALTLGFSAPYRFFRIILPQALPLMIPPFGNALVTMVKFTSLVSLVTIQDLTFRANLVGSSLGDSSYVYVIVIFAYFGINYLLGRAALRLERIVNRSAGADASSLGTGASSSGGQSRVPSWALGVSR